MNQPEQSAPDALPAEFIEWYARTNFINHEGWERHIAWTAWQASRTSQAAAQSGDALPVPMDSQVGHLLRRATRQLSKWHQAYGDWRCDWLPPAGDVTLQEDIAAALAKPPQEPSGDARDALIDSAMSTVRQDYSHDALAMASAREYVADAVAQLIDAGYRLAKPPQEIEATPPQVEPAGCHGLDTPERVRFYEHDFYVLSNFSAFELRWLGRTFHTAEAAYHYEKFAADEDNEPAMMIALDIYTAPSAHEAFKIAETNKSLRRADWDDVKVDIMRDILRAKVDQHEYVRRKLLATGNRDLVEDSWRDDFWGWGPNRSGRNMLGKLWMTVRDELIAAAPKPEAK